MNSEKKPKILAGETLASNGTESELSRFGERKQDIKVQRRTDEQIIAEFAAKKLEPSVLPSIVKIVLYAITILAAVSLAIFRDFTTAGVLLVVLAIDGLILTFGFVNVTYPEEAVIFAKGRYYSRWLAGWSFIIPVLMQVKLKIAVDTLIPVDALTDEQHPINVKNDSIRVKAVVGIIVVDVVRAALNISIPPEFRARRTKASKDLFIAVEYIIDSALRSTLGTKELDEILNENAKLTTDGSAYHTAKESGKVVPMLKSELAEKIEEIADSMAAAIGVNISNIQIEEIILSEQTRQTRSKLLAKSVALEIQRKDTLIETEKVNTVAQQGLQTVIRESKIGEGLGKNIQIAAKEAGITPQEIVNLRKIEAISQGNTTMVLSGDGSGNLAGLGVTIGTGAAIGSKAVAEKKPKKMKKQGSTDQETETTEMAEEESGTE